MIDAMTQAAKTAGAGSATAGGATTKSTGLDKDAFMKLLVAQLRYQNPMNPADGQQYMAQAAQFAAVEKLSDIATAQSEAVAYQQILLSSSLVGRHVKATEGDATVEGLVTGVKFDKGNNPLLVVGDKEIPVGTVEEVTAATTA
jgi:flagellar basal-body rod modification protein FlgD